jgi:peptide/nickel transport system substrate-binding protein
MGDRKEGTRMNIRAILGRKGPIRRLRRSFGAAGLALVLCSSGVALSTGTSAPAAAANSNKIVVAFPVGLSPNYIFPIMPAQDFAEQNLSYFTYLLFRPLYWYGKGTTTNLNEAQSLALPPVYNSTDTAVTIHLKKWSWSNGQPVTSRDIEFWQNLIVAGKSGWAAYTPGAYPDNVTSTTIINPTTIRFNLNEAVSPSWFTYNELSQITPLPQSVMDVTSATSPVGDYDRTPSGATAVYNYLNTEGQKVTTFASNPLWKVVDGAWKLQSITQTGMTTYVANTSFDGGPKPSVSQLVEEPFASPSAVTNALLSGSVNYSVITSDQIPLLSRFKSNGYTNATTSLYGIQGLIPNENNPKYGPLFKQTYFRQVLERLVDQPAIISKLQFGSGNPSCGPVPLAPASKYLSALEKKCPLSFSPTKAAASLKSHGWKVVPGGVDVCQRGGASGCGAGVTTGEKLQFSVIYPQGFGLDSMILLLKSDAAKVGIQYSIQSVSIATDFGTVLPCASTSSSCNWQIGYYVFIYQPDYLPTGDTLFLTGAASNVANYSSPTADGLIKTTFHSASLSAFQKYEDYLTEQAPWIFLPFSTVHYEVTAKLHGAVPINTFLFIDPENWRFK